MSCYFRHLKDVFAEAGIVVTPENKKELDQAFHHIVNVPYKECPVTWKKIKTDWLADPKQREQLVAKLRDALRE